MELSAQINDAMTRTCQQLLENFDEEVHGKLRVNLENSSLEEKLQGRKQIKARESQRKAKRRALFDAQDEMDRRREQLISEIGEKLQQKLNLAEVFRIQWKVS